MKKQISIIGGGPSALLLAAFLDESKYHVTIYEKNKSVGRKFLVAGDGGFNLTHSEPIEEMVGRYTPSTFLRSALLKFTNQDLQDWLSELGIPTFVGSSRRVYPEKGIKPIEVINAILQFLEKKNVSIEPEHEWVGWNELNQPIFKNGTIISDGAIVFALGGGSWSVTGSKGDWLNFFKAKNVEVEEFFPSNCAYEVSWASDFSSKYAGQPLKNIAISCNGGAQKGEVVVTNFGLEGNAIYALSPQIRAGLKTSSKVNIQIDFKPSMDLNSIISKMRSSKSKKTTDILKKDLKLSPVQLGLIKAYVSKDDFLNIDKLAITIKSLSVEVVGTEVLDKAISTVGGVQLSAVDSNFQLKTLSNQYCIGEMLDWDAPTGGYLLQGSFSMGVSLAKHFNSLD